MSPRSIRRAAERKQRKLERKQLRLAVPAPDHHAPLDNDFSPELIAEAQAMRKRIEARMTAPKLTAPTPPTPPALSRPKANWLRVVIRSNTAWPPASSSFLVKIRQNSKPFCKL